MIDSISEFSQPVLEIKNEKSYRQLVESKILDAQKELEYVDPVVRNFITDNLSTLIYGDNNAITFSVTLSIDKEEFFLKSGFHKDLVDEDIPVIKINNVRDFLQALTEYVVTVKHVNPLVYREPLLLQNVFLNMTDVDFADPVTYIKLQTEIYKSTQLSELNEVCSTEIIPSLGTRLWIQQLPADISYESPVKLETILSDEKPDSLDTPPGTMPVSRFAIISKNGEKTGYVYSLQDMTKHNGADWANKESIKSQINVFESASERLASCINKLIEIDPRLVTLVFGDIPKNIIGKLNKPSEFAVSLSNHLAETRPEFGKIYFDKKRLQEMGISEEIQKLTNINYNTISFAGFCRERNEEIQLVLKRRRFRNKIDRKLLEIVRDGSKHESEEARSYLKEIQDIKSKFNRIKDDAENEYKASTEKKKLVNIVDSSRYAETQRLKMVHTIMEADDLQEQELSGVEHVENISEVSPSAVVSLLVCLTEMQKAGVRKVIIPTNMPFRWQNHILTSMNTKDPNLERAINIHHNITEKFIRTIRHVSVQVPGVEIVVLPDSPEIPMEIRLDPEKWDSEQPILHEIIAALMIRE